MVQLYFYLSILTTTIFIASGCQTGMRDAIRHIQKNNPQACMQCPEIKVSNLCQSGSIAKNVTCGQTRVDYHTYWSKQTCAKAMVHCSVKLPRSSEAVIAVDQFEIETTISDITTTNAAENVDGSGEDIPITEESEDGSGEEISDSEASGTPISESEENVSATEVGVSESNDEEGSPFAYISTKAKYYTHATLTCNDEGKWEAEVFDSDRTITGIEKVYCFVGNDFEV